MALRDCLDCRFPQDGQNRAPSGKTPPHLTQFIVYLDDCVEGREEAKNRQRLDDKWEVISGDILGRAIEGTPIVATGTRYSLYDPIGHLQEEAQKGGWAWKAIEIPALDPVTDESNYEYERDGKKVFKFNRQMKELAAAIRPLSDEMQRLGTGFAALPARLQRAIAMVNQYNTAVQRGEKRTSLFGKATSALRFGILYAGLRRVVGLIGTAITESNTYQEDLNLFNVALGKYAKEAQNYAEKVSSVMGIDPAQWMRNQGVFQTLLTGFGDTEDRAYTMSKNLTQLWRKQA